MNMTEIKTYCDHCKKILDTKTDYCETTLDFYSKWITVDLCTECYDNLYNYVCKYCGQGAGDTNV